MKTLEIYALEKAGFHYGNGMRVAWTPCGERREDHVCCFFRLKMQVWNGKPADILWLGDVTTDTLEPITDDARLVSELYDRAINPQKYRETSLLLKSLDLRTQVGVHTGTDSVNLSVFRAGANRKIQSAIAQLAALRSPEVDAILHSGAVATEGTANGQPGDVALSDERLVQLLRRLAETGSSQVHAILYSEGISVYDTMTGRELVTHEP